METRDTKIYIDGQPFEGIGEFMAGPKFADNQLDLVRNSQGKEFSFEVAMTREQAMRLAELISPYFRDFSEAFHETVRTSPKRWHIFRYTKRARIRKKHYKSFVTELIYRIETKAKVREDHATV